MRANLVEVPGWGTPSSWRHLPLTLLQYLDFSLPASSSPPSRADLLLSAVLLLSLAFDLINTIVSFFLLSRSFRFYLSFSPSLPVVARDTIAN